MTNDFKSAKMNILVTGALGHIGSGFIRKLNTLKGIGRIYLIDNLTTMRYSSLFNLPESQSFKFINANVEDISKITLDTNLDIVIHLAALTDPSLSAQKPELFKDNNIKSTKCVIDLCKLHDARLVSISSTSIYGKSGTLLSEDCSQEYIAGQSPYAECKIKEEEIVMQAINDGLNAYILRFGTIFGVSPGMRFHTAVNKFCWQASMNIPIMIWETALNQLRPYLALEDAISLLLFIINNSNIPSGIYNAATEHTTVSKIVDSIKIYKPESNITFVKSEIMNELTYSVSVEKLKALGFSFKGNMMNDIEKTMKLFSAFK